MLIGEWTTTSTRVQADDAIAMTHMSTIVTSFVIVAPVVDEKVSSTEMA